MGKCISEGKNNCVFSVLYCGRKFTAVGSIVLPYLFLIETFAWYQKTLYKSLTSLLCAYYGSGSKTHTAASASRVMKTLNKEGTPEQQNLCPHHNQITSLVVWHSVSFLLICPRPKQTKALMNLLFCPSFTYSPKHLMQWCLRCPLCSSVLSIKFFCVYVAVSSSSCHYVKGMWVVWY